MKVPVYQKLELGELVAAAYDEAARYSTDSREVSRLATLAITHLLQTARQGTRAGPASKRAEKNVAGVTAAAFRLLRSAACSPQPAVRSLRSRERAPLNPPSVQHRCADPRSGERTNENPSTL